MTYKEIAEMIESMGLPYAYHAFPNNGAPELPYIVFNYPSRDDFGADNFNYVHIENVDIELYTENKDFATESAIESVLEQNGLFYSKTEMYLESEYMYEILYEVQTVIK